MIRTISGDYTPSSIASQKLSLALSNTGDMTPIHLPNFTNVKQICSSTDTFYILYNNQLYYSENLADFVWIDTSSLGEIKQIAYNFPRFYVATDKGIYISEDNTSFTVLPLQYIHELKVIDKVAYVLTARYYASRFTVTFNKLDGNNLVELCSWDVSNSSSAKLAEGFHFDGNNVHTLTTQGKGLSLSIINKDYEFYGENFDTFTNVFTTADGLLFAGNDNFYTQETYYEMPEYFTAAKYHGKFVAGGTFFISSYSTDGKTTLDSFNGEKFLSQFDKEEVGDYGFLNLPELGVITQLIEFKDAFVFVTDYLGELKLWRVHVISDELNHKHTPDDISLSKPFELQGKPLTNGDRFESMTDAEAFLATGKAYTGQKVTIAEGDRYYLYLVQEDVLGKKYFERFTSGSAMQSFQSLYEASEAITPTTLADYEGQIITVYEYDDEKGTSGYVPYVVDNVNGMPQFSVIKGGGGGGETSLTPKISVYGKNYTGSGTEDDPLNIAINYGEDLSIMLRVTSFNTTGTSTISYIMTPEGSTTQVLSSTKGGFTQSYTQFDLPLSQYSQITRGVYTLYLDCKDSNGVSGSETYCIKVSVGKVDVTLSDYSKNLPNLPWDIDSTTTQPWLECTVSSYIKEAEINLVLDYGGKRHEFPITENLLGIEKTYYLDTADLVLGLQPLKIYAEMTETIDGVKVVTTSQITDTQVYMLSTQRPSFVTSQYGAEFTADSQFILDYMVNMLVIRDNTPTLYDGEFTVKFKRKLYDKDGDLIAEDADWFVQSTLSDTPSQYIVTANPVGAAAFQEGTLVITAFAARPDYKEGDATGYSETIIDLNILPSDYKVIIPSLDTVRRPAFYYRCAGTTNSDLNRAKIQNTVQDTLATYPITSKEDTSVALENFNYMSNGWFSEGVGESTQSFIKFNGHSQLQLPFAPFKENLTWSLNEDITEGYAGQFTFEAKFRTRDIGDPEARVIDCSYYNPNLHGFYVTYDKICIGYEGATVEEIPISPETWIHMAIVINLNPSKAGSAYGRMFVYINGVIVRICQVPTNADFTNPNPIYINCGQPITGETIKPYHGNMDLAMVRGYYAALPTDLVVDNYLADLDLATQKERFEINGTSSVIRTMDRVIYYGDLTALRSKDEKVNVACVYKDNQSGRKEWKTWRMDEPLELYDGKTFSIENDGTEEQKLLRILYDYSYLPEEVISYLDGWDLTKALPNTIEEVNNSVVVDWLISMGWATSDGKGIAAGLEKALDMIIKYNYFMSTTAAWQGTSTLEWPIKNYKIKMKKTFAANTMINGDQEEEKWKPEKVYTMKADYMESSHTCNTGICKLVDTIYNDSGVLIPPQKGFTHKGVYHKADIKQRNCIDGYPVEVICRYPRKTDAYNENGDVIYETLNLGIYMFNMDKTSPFNMGFEYKDDNGDTQNFGEVFSFECGANTDNSAAGYVVPTPEEILTWDLETFSNKVASTKAYNETGNPDGLQAYYERIREGLQSTDASVKEATFDEFLKDYINATWEVRYAYDDTQDLGDVLDDKDYQSVFDKTCGPGSVDSFRNMIRWVGERIYKADGSIDTEAEKIKFREELDTYIDKDFMLSYLIIAYMFACVDSLGKNCMMTTWTNGKYYPCWYDVDTALGVDNGGTYSVPSSADMIKGLFFNRVGKGEEVYPTGTEGITDTRMLAHWDMHSSVLWEKVRRYYSSELKEKYAQMRKKDLTYDFVINFLQENIWDKIAERLYCSEYELKYNMDNEYPQSDKKPEDIRTFMLNYRGDRKEQIKNFLRERFKFVDSVFDYKDVDNDVNTSVSIKFNKVGTYTLKVQTISPVLMTVNATGGASGGSQIYTKFATPDKPAEFTFQSTTGYEVVFSFAETITEFGNLSDFSPAAFPVGLGPAYNLRKLELYNNASLEEISLERNTKLRELRIVDCTGLNKAISVANCLNLTVLDLHGSTNIPAVVTYDVNNVSNSASSLEVIDINNTNITSLALYGQTILTDETLTLPEDGKVTNISLNSCLGFNKFEAPTTIQTLTLRSCSNIENVSIVSAINLMSVTLVDLPKLKYLKLSSSGLGGGTVAKDDLIKELDLQNVPSLEQATITSMSSLKKVYVPRESSLISIALQYSAISYFGSEQDYSVDTEGTIDLSVMKYQGFINMLGCASIKKVINLNYKCPASAVSFEVEEDGEFKTITNRAQTSDGTFQNIWGSSENWKPHNLFTRMTSLESIEGTKLDTSATKSLYSFLLFTSKLKSIILGTDLSGLIITGATSLSYAFAKSGNGLPKSGDYFTEEGILTNDFFRKLTQKISSTLTNITGVFREANLAGFDYNGEYGISSSLFEYCTKVTSLSHIFYSTVSRRMDPTILKYFTATKTLSCIFNALKLQTPCTLAYDALWYNIYVTNFASAFTASDNVASNATYGSLTRGGGYFNLNLSSKIKATTIKSKWNSIVGATTLANLLAPITDAEGNCLVADLLFLRASTSTTSIAAMLAGCNVTGSMTSTMLSRLTNLTNAAGLFAQTKIDGQYPEGIFDKNTKLTNLSYFVYMCSDLNTFLVTGTESTAIRKLPFAKLTALTNLSYHFYGCKNTKTVTSTDSDGNSFEETVLTGLSGDIPEEIFENNKKLTNIKYCFGKTNITGINALTSKNNTGVSQFFKGLTALADISYLFYDTNFQGYTYDYIVNETDLVERIGGIPKEMFYPLTALTTADCCFRSCPDFFTFATTAEQRTIPAMLFRYSTKLKTATQFFRGTLPHTETIDVPYTGSPKPKDKIYFEGPIFLRRDKYGNDLALSSNQLTNVAMFFAECSGMQTEPILPHGTYRPITEEVVNEETGETEIVAVLDSYGEPRYDFVKPVDGNIFDYPFFYGAEKVTNVNGFFKDNYNLQIQVPEDFFRPMTALKRANAVFQNIHTIIGVEVLEDNAIVSYALHPNLFKYNNALVQLRQTFANVCWDPENQGSTITIPKNLIRHCYELQKLDYCFFQYFNLFGDLGRAYKAQHKFTGALDPTFFNNFKTVSNGLAVEVVSPSKINDIRYIFAYSGLTSINLDGTPTTASLFRYNYVKNTYFNGAFAQCKSLKGNYIDVINQICQNYPGVPTPMNGKRSFSNVTTYTTSIYWGSDGLTGYSAMTSYFKNSGTNNMDKNRITDADLVAAV